MKIKYLIYIAIFALVATSCTESAVDDLQGLYKAPEALIKPELINDGVVDINNLNCFNIVVKDNNSTVHLALTGDRYFLDADYFTLANPNSIQKNKILASLTYVEHNGKECHPTDGSVSVTRSGDAYTLSGVLWFDDESIVKFYAEGTLIYERKASKLANPIWAEITELTDDLNQLYLVIGGEGVTGKKVGADIQYSGTGALFITHIIFDKQSDILGTYTAADAVYGGDDSQFVAGTFLKGYTHMLDLFGYQIPISIYTCWYKVVDGQQTDDCIQLQEGEISISKSGNSYNITVDCGELYAIYEGKLDIKKPISEDEATYTYTDTQEAKENGIQHTIALCDPNGKVAAQFVFVSADSNVAGTYTYADPAENPGDLSRGVELFGISLGSYYTVKNVKYYLSGGILEVEDSNDILSLKATDLKAESAGGEKGEKSEITFLNVAKQ